MAGLYGTGRDVSLITSLNRELINRLIDTKVGYYKISLDKTTSDIYGEANGTKTYNNPVLINCLIERGEQQTNTDDFGPDVNRDMKFKFLLSDLKGNYIQQSNAFKYDIVPETGDIILWNENYYEVNAIVENQLFMGKDPVYAYTDSDTNFGNSISIILSAHYTRPEKLGIKNERL